MKIFNKIIREEMKLRNSRPDYMTFGVVDEPSELGPHEFDFITILHREYESPQFGRQDSKAMQSHLRGILID